MERGRGLTRDRHLSSQIQSLLLAACLAIGLFVVRPIAVSADQTIRNTDMYRDNFNGGTSSSYVTSGWWNFTSAPVNQRYGCTSYPHRDHPGTYSMGHVADRAIEDDVPLIEPMHEPHNLSARLNRSAIAIARSAMSS